MSNVEDLENLREIKFLVLRGTLSDLSILDFSSYNVKILQINENEFKQYIEEHSSPRDREYNWDPFEEILEPLHGTEKIFAVVPKNILSQFSVDDLLLCYDTLLLMFPSDLKITHVVDFQITEQNQLYYCCYADYGFRSTGNGNYFENYVLFDEQYNDEINEFLKIFKPRHKRIKYAKQALESYVSSFQAHSLQQGYLDLCICLETIMEGTTEISYRIKHHIAVLCSENEDHAKTIYSNIGKIYTVRSKIVHGELVKENKIIEYLPYLRCLISRMIIEVILLNIPERKQLDTILTFAGYNKKPTLTNEYKKMTLNLISYVNSFAKELN